MSRAREDFLIWQYRGKLKARQTVGLLLSETKAVFGSVLDVADVLNIEKSKGYALDLVGRHVGIGRTMKAFIPRDYFGWLGVEGALGFNEGVWYRHGDSLTDSVRLSDDDYRFFIKSKIIKNYQSPTIDSISDSIRSLLGNQALAIDNLDMTMSVIIPLKDLNAFRLYALQKLDILARPIGVFYKYFIITSDRPFGWAGDDSTFGFNDGTFTRILNNASS